MSTTTAAPLTKCTPCLSILTGTLGPDRVGAFRTSSKCSTLDNVVQKAVGRAAQLDFPLNLDQFIVLLKKMTGGGYNGMRVYFACYSDAPSAAEYTIIPKGEEGQLNFLFVPTIDNGNPTGGDDDPGQFWHLNSAGELTHLGAPGSTPSSQDFVTNWIGHYRNDRMNALETEARPNRPKFQETRSLWYSKLSIVGGETDEGLIPFIACARQASTGNPVIGLDIQLAIFLPGDTLWPEYQLSLVFNLRQQDDPVNPAHALTFGTSRSLFEAFPSDTGIPCPPAPNCVGSSLSCGC